MQISVCLFDESLSRAHNLYLLFLTNFYWNHVETNEDGAIATHEQQGKISNSGWNNISPAGLLLVNW